METQKIHLGDRGVQFILEVEEDGAVVDISAATSLVMYFKHVESGTVSEGKTATILSGTDGTMEHTTTDSLGTTDKVGEWQYQGELTIGQWRGRTHPKKYKVLPNL